MMIGIIWKCVRSIYISYTHTHRVAYTTKKQPVVFFAKHTHTHKIVRIKFQFDVSSKSSSSGGGGGGGGHGLRFIESMINWVVCLLLKKKIKFFLSE